jgi:hypothetical protein
MWSKNISNWYRLIEFIRKEEKEENLTNTIKIKNKSEACTTKEKKEKALIQIDWK